MPISVTALSITPVKSTRLQEVDTIELGRSGVPDNRRFYVVDRRRHLINGKRLGELNAIVAQYAAPRLKLTFLTEKGAARTLTVSGTARVDRLALTRRDDSPRAAAKSIEAVIANLDLADIQHFLVTRTPALEGVFNLGCYALVGGRDTHWAE